MMVWRLSFCLIMVLVIPSVQIVSAQGEQSLWETVAPGIEYRVFRLSDPNNVFVARMDRSNPSITVESSIAQGKLSSGLETVSNMASRYNQAINYWGSLTLNPREPYWGNTNKVVVAINGSYLQSPTSSVPWSGQVHSGWYAKRFNNFETGSGGSGFAWLLSRTVFIGQCVFHNVDKQRIIYASTNDYQRFHGINVARGNNQLIIYTPQFDSTTKTANDSNAVEVLVELNQPKRIIPEPNTVPGVVKAIRDGQGSTSIPFDHIVLSAHGDARVALLNKLAANGNVGSVIGISQEISNCPDTPNWDWTNTYASVAGAYYFLNDGAVNSFSSDSGATSRHPRTAIAYNSQYIFFIVVDGRNPGVSRGMTIGELANFAKNVLGATHGIAQDGGGSSTMVVNGRVVNNTFCNNVFCKGNVYLPLVMKPGSGAQSTSAQQESSQGAEDPPADTPEAEAMAVVPEKLITVQDGEGEYLFSVTTTERWVPNGMMMVVVEPMATSNKFSAGNSVKVLSNANLRLGPGTNYWVLNVIEKDAANGVVVAHPLNGVFAKGYYWWKVNFEGQVGWMAESLLGP